MPERDLGSAMCGMMRLVKAKNRLGEGAGMQTYDRGRIGGCGCCCLRLRR